MLPNETDAPKRIYAAEYLRMSTEHQRFSIAAQRATIAEYAELRGYEVVRSYIDPGKSGLSLKGRNALRCLLGDVLKPDRGFDVILVVDVSRWGRFKDPDQAAHYEFLCRQAGVQVIYCAEPFESDISPVHSIMKNLKRIMAHEFSRELSDKLILAHSRQAGLGLKQGAPPPFGFRRMLVDAEGRPKFTLGKGEWKSLRQDRVRFCLGPLEEQETIKLIFDLYVRQKYSLSKLAGYLNENSILRPNHKDWKPGTVRAVLTNELTIGIYTYNRTNQRLQGKVQRNPENLWVRAPAKIDSLVSSMQFVEAQDRIRSARPSNEYLLEGLRRLYRREGRLSTAIVDASPDIPSATTYQRRFGTFSQALRQIEYVRPRCIAGLDRAWTDADLRVAFRRLHAENGFLSCALIDADPSLPSYHTIRRQIGKMPEIYAFVGLPPKTHSAALKEAMARKRKRLGRIPHSRAEGDGVWTQRAMIASLRKLLNREGYLSRHLIDSTPNLPCARTLEIRFGSLLRAYNAAGWMVDRNQVEALKRKRMIAART